MTIICQDFVETGLFPFAGRRIKAHGVLSYNTVEFHVSTSNNIFKKIVIGSSLISLPVVCIFFSFIVAELCALSEFRIYPGTGKLFVRRDGKPIFLGSSKAYSMTLQRKKPAKLVWTQAWRRLHKKGISETSTKKRTRRSNKIGRAVVGIALDDIRKKAAQKPEFRSSMREAALKEVKARKVKSKSTKGRGSSTGAGQKSKTPKSVIRTMQRSQR